MRCNCCYVPNLRFSEFDYFWLPTTLSSICSFRKKRKSSIKKFYVSTENILQNYKGIEQYNSNEVISGVEFLTGDILMANIRPYLKKVYMAEFDGVSNSDVLIFKSDMVDSNFLHCILANDNFINYVMNSVKGSKMPRGDKIHIMNYHLSIPKAKEQEKIAKFIDLINQRIDTQSKIIEKYESLIKAISNKLFFNITNRVNLSEICSITTGKLDANQMDENGIYPFFTCGKETLKINKYAFDCEAILISGNGDIGRTKYYNGKFNAYQRTYILYNFKGSPIFIKYAIDYALPKKVKEETQISAMPYIKMGTLSELSIPYPDIHIQIEDVQILNTLQTKINVEKEILEKLKEQKKYLLSNMFI